MKIHSFDQLEPLQQAVADSFAQLVDETIPDGKRFSVSLSGGSTPRRIYELIAECNLPWERIHWFWGDERNVPHDHRDSNFQMVQQALLGRINAPAENVHAVPVNLENPAAAAAAYEQVLRRHFGEDEFPCWDLNLLGLGEDAHTASLFPQTEALRQQQRWFVENWVEKFGAYRYTLTAPAINSARQTWFLVTGTAKQQALTQVLAGTGDSNQFPALLIRPDRWFVTSDAMW